MATETLASKLLAIRSIYDSIDMTGIEYRVRCALQARGHDYVYHVAIPGDGVGAPGAMVAYKKGNEYVTHFFNAQDGGFHQGHYMIPTEKAAITDVWARARVEG